MAQIASTERSECGPEPLHRSPKLHIRLGLRCRMTNPNSMISPESRRRGCRHTRDGTSDIPESLQQAGGESLVLLLTACFVVAHRLLISRRSTHVPKRPHRIGAPRRRRPFRRAAAASGGRDHQGRDHRGRTKRQGRRALARAHLTIGRHGQSAGRARVPRRTRFGQGRQWNPDRAGWHAAGPGVHSGFLVIGGPISGPNAWAIAPLGEPRCSATQATRSTTSTTIAPTMPPADLW